MPEVGTVVERRTVNQLVVHHGQADRQPMAVTWSQVSVTTFLSAKSSHILKIISCYKLEPGRALRGLFFEKSAKISPKNISRPSQVSSVIHYSWLNWTSCAKVSQAGNLFPFGVVFPCCCGVLVTIVSINSSSQHSAHYVSIAKHFTMQRGTLGSQEKDPSNLYTKDS